MTDPLSFPPIEVELESFGIDGNNNIWVRLHFADGSDWDLEWSADSPEAHQVLEFFSRLSSETVARAGARGLRLTGITPLTQEGEGA
jgi:hypothetical protein